MSTTTENTEKLLSFIAEKFQTDQLNNHSLVQIIELCGAYLNLMTVSEYARQNNMSYNGVKYCRNVLPILGVRMVIDNM